MSENSFVITGLHYGEHDFIPEEIIPQVKKFGKDCRLAMIRPKAGVDVTPEQYYEWAKYFRDNGIYFCFLYSVRNNNGEAKSIFTKEITEKMYEIAGEYFIGDSLGEMGNGWQRHVYEKRGEENAQFKNVQEAKDTFVSDVRRYVEASRGAGMKNIGVVESHTMIKYDFEAGVDIGYPELLLGNPEHILSFTRGATRARGKEEFGGYIAHEWYGGVRHDDPLKNKRLGLIYKTAYMAGAEKIFIESGYESTSSYGVRGNENHPYCQMVRKEIEEFNNYINTDLRPQNGPKVKVAFISGNLDGYAGNSIAYGGVISAVWGQRGRKEWDKGAPEHSWRILDEVYRSCDWHNPVNYGDYDYSGAPGYGIYDVLPAEASFAAMSRYEWLIFAGWNTMTEEIYENLKKYVSNGGNLLISAAHMKTGNVRGEDSPYIYNGQLEDFLGCNLTEKKFRSNKSYKFARKSIAEGVYYPGTVDHTKDLIDPIGADGYATYVEIEEKSCRKTAFLGKSFSTTPEDYEKQASVLVEHRYGKGNVLFMCTNEYPGAAGVYTLYKIIVKAILAGTHRNCDIKVIGSDKVRFSVYEDENRYKVYLLNTDMNFEQKIRVIYNGKSEDKVVLSTGLDFVELQK